VNFFRGIAVLLTQSTIIYYAAGTRDLLFGFNQTTAGLVTLLLLLVSAPLLNLSWLVVEIKRAFKQFRHRESPVFLLMPLVAVLFLVESVAIDGYILAQVRM